MKRCRPLLGTFVEIILPNVNDREAEAAQGEHAIESAFAAINLVHSLMSFHDQSSELARLNAAAHRSRQIVHPWTYEVLSIAKDLFEQTNGLFDCAVGARLVEWKFLPCYHEERWLAAAVGAHLSDLELHEDFAVSYRCPMVLDLGGIAKGFAVDCAIEALKSCGIDAALVNAGGDIRVWGPVAEPIHIRNPSDPQQLICAGHLADGAIATSAAYYSCCNMNGEARSALIDPITRYAIVERKSFSVIAPTCVVADGLTKAVAASQDADLSFLRRYDAQALVF